MNEKVINALIQLYALLAYANKDKNALLAKNFIESFLSKRFKKKLVNEQLIEFDRLIKIYNETLQSNNLTETLSQLIKEINQQLHIKQKYLVLINILQFMKHWRIEVVGNILQKDTTTEIFDYMTNLFKTTIGDFTDLNHFISEKPHLIEDRNKLLIIHDNQYLNLPGFNTFIHKGLTGTIYFFHITEINTYLFNYSGEDRIEIQDHSVFPNHIYILDKGSSLRGENIEPIYYSNIVFNFLNAKAGYSISLLVKNLEFTFPKSNSGIHKLSFEASSGMMVGIMGGSGTGKSTLLNLLNGNIQPTKGQIKINGIPISERNGLLSGMIGFIPQDDLLVEELSVYKNLYYSAQLCFGNLSDVQIKERVDKALIDLDLFHIKDLKVGNPLDKFISGGQRKRLNIAFELIREPYVLFVDEPTSGLSSTDSERVIELLKEQALSGKLVIVNIHQPSAEIFKQFDQMLVLDKGGYPVYYGNPIDGITYVENIAGIIEINKYSNQINPDDLLKTIELNKTDEYGIFTYERKVTPEEWYEHFTIKLQKEIKPDTENKALPKTIFSPPKSIKQFKVFFKRNLFSKIADTQFLTISLLITPLLATLLAFLTRYMAEMNDGKPTYIFIENENIPAFIFMSIIVALFVGLIVSAEDIFRDRKIIQREMFLNLGKLSYLNSKIIFLLVLSAIQTACYVLLGNTILGIKNMYFNFWIFLFSSSFFANLLGLNISAAFKSAVSIYIIIPLVLVPQILLSGSIVSFDKLNNSLSGGDHVPFIGDIMTSRWAYEGMMASQFTGNLYNKEFYYYDQKISNTSFVSSYKIPKLQDVIGKTIQQIKNNDKPKEFDRNIKLLKAELAIINQQNNAEIPANNFVSIDDLRILNTELNNLKTRYAKMITLYLGKKDRITDSLNNKYGETYVYKLKVENYNNRLGEFVLKSNEINRISIINNHIVRLYEPIYYIPESTNGRAHFFAPLKRLGFLTINTLLFNVMAIWFITILLYIALWRNWLKRLIDFLSQIFDKRSFLQFK
jgi:ABC transport system ATP-binding/permease protein